MTAFPEFPQDDYDFNANEVGQALAGLVARDALGNPIPGMIAPPTVVPVSGAWKVQVSRFVHVRNVAGSARFSGLSASEQVDIATAASIPAGQARIDRVCWNPVTGVLVVLPGTPGVSPVAPGAGALASVATVRVQAGDSQVVAARVIPDFAVTSLGKSTSDGQRGWLPHMAGGTLLGGNMYTSAVFLVTFPKAFDDVPWLQVTSAANASNVAQWAQAFDVTKTEFKFRILSINAGAGAGSVSWEARPK